MYTVYLHPLRSYDFSDADNADEFAFLWRAILKDREGNLIADYSKLPKEFFHS